MPPLSTPQQLATARQWLSAGRPDEARRILAMAQTQMVLQPVTPDQPQAQGTSDTAAAIGDALRWLDMGANAQAMQSITRAIDGTGPTARVRAWSGYSMTPPTPYQPSPMPDYSTDR
jgi:hypothetical protein